MYYKFDQLTNYLDAKNGFHKINPIEVSSCLKNLPENLAMRVIYSEIAEVFESNDKNKMQQIVSVVTEYGISIPTDPDEVNENIDRYLSIDNSDFEKSIEILLKSAWLEDGTVTNIDVSKEEYDFLKDDFLEREKYELIDKMKVI